MPLHAWLGAMLMAQSSAMWLQKESAPDVLTPDALPTLRIETVPDVLTPDGLPMVHIETADDFWHTAYSSDGAMKSKKAKAAATRGCGSVVLPVKEGGALEAISEEQRCSLYCLLENVPVAVKALELARDVHYKKCAVVSSSGAMLEHTFGPEIDAADAVMRFGTPSLGKRYERHVGKKETFRFLNVVMQAKERGGVQGLSLGSFSSGIFLVTDGLRPHAQPGIVPLGEIHFGLVEVLQQTFPQFNYTPGHEVTAGMTGITFLLRMCDEVVLYEMIPSPVALNKPWHYWEPGGNAAHNNWHNSLFFEQALWKLLAGAQGNANTGRVTLQGFSTRPRSCGPGPTPLPRVQPEGPPVALACDNVTIRLDGKDESYSEISHEQRCALYCRLENLVPKGAAMRELVGRVRYGTCAVVSNSRALRKWRHGSEIDKVDAVMRFDTAELNERSRRHAGSKETFRMLNARRQSTAVSGLQLGAFREGLFLLTDGWSKDELPEGEPGVAESENFVAQPGVVPLGEVQQGLMEVLNYTFSEFEHEPGHKVTSGMTGITLMLHLCDEVVLYEMVPSKKRASRKSQHDPSRYEHAFWRALAGPEDTSRTGAIRLEGFRTHASQCAATH